MTRKDGDNGSWWGDLRLAENQAARWRIGPLELVVRRGRHEWQAAWGWNPERTDSQDWELEREAELPEEPQHHERFVVGETGVYTVGVMAGDGAWLSLAQGERFEAGTHFLERALEADEAPLDAQVIAGAPAEVDRARRGDDDADVVVMPVVGDGAR